MEIEGFGDFYVNYVFKKLKRLFNKLTGMGELGRQKNKLKL